MPPSSDPPWADNKKKGSQRGKRKRRPGGQPGHEGKTRALLPPDQVDDFVECHPPTQCSCGGHVAYDNEDPQRLQNLELQKIKAFVTEYLFFSGLCDQCGRRHLGKLPPGAPAGVLGPRAMAAVAVLSGKYHLSKRQVEEVLQDLLGIQVSLGTVSNTEARVSAALEQPVEEAKAYVREQPVVHADETGHKMAGKKAWMWTAVTVAVSVFLIRFTRATKAAKELLGAAFGGILVSDRWGAYNWVDATRRQLCWSHLIRDLVKIEARGGRSEEIASAILEYVKEMFALWHTFQEGKRQRRWLQRKMKVIREEVENLLEQGEVCYHVKTQETCKRILKLKDALWTYVDVPGVDPTNNLAERTIRPYVLWRRVSFGTQSERGNLFVERMMTVSATCRQQERNVLEYVTAAVRAHLQREAIPSLLPQAPGELTAAAA